MFPPIDKRPPYCCTHSTFSNAIPLMGGMLPGILLFWFMMRAGLIDRALGTAGR